jgi:hypothetical protein
VGKLGDVLSAGGKGLLKGMENYGGPMGGIPGSGMDMAGGPASGVGLMSLLFDKLGIFGNKKKEMGKDPLDPNNFVGPRY